MLVLEGHTGPVNALAFAPDGEMLASVGKDGMVRLWAAPSEIASLSLHPDGVNAVAFSPDGRYLASGGNDQLVRVLDTRNQRVLFKSEPLKHAVSVIGFAGEGTVVFGIGERPGPVARPSTLSLLDLVSGKSRRFPFDVVNGIRALTALPARKLVAWATDTKLLRVQDVSRPPGKAAILKNDCRAIALSHDGRKLAVSSDWEILIFDLDRWPSQPATLGRHQGTVSALAFGADSRTLLSGSWDGTVRVWDLEHASQSASYTWPVGNRVTALAVSSDGLRATAAGDLGTIVVWDLD